MNAVIEIVNGNTVIPLYIDPTATVQVVIDNKTVFKKLGNEPCNVLWECVQEPTEPGPHYIDCVVYATCGNEHLPATIIPTAIIDVR